MTSKPRSTHPHPVPDTPASYNGPVTAEACLGGFMMMLFRGHQIENVDNPIATQPHTKTSTRGLGAGIFGSRGRQILYDGEPTVYEVAILDAKAARFIEDRVHAKERSPALLSAGTGR
jgi:hypothetical protein